MRVSIGSIAAGIAAFVLALAPVSAARPTRPVLPHVAVIADNLCPTGDDPDAIQVCALKLRPQDIVRLHGYAGCLADRHGDEARTAVRAYVDRNSSDELRALVTAGSDCRPSDATRISGILLQGSLAEHLINVRGGAAPIALDPGTKANLVDCLVALDPGSSAGLLRSRPLSPREGAMINRLAADLPSCVPTGTKLETNALALRAMVALAMFNVIEPRPADAPAPVDQPLITSLPLVADAKTQRIVAILPAIRVQQRSELPRMFEPHGHPGLMPYLNPEDIEAAGAAFCVDVSCLDDKTVKVPVSRDTNSNPYNTNGPAGITTP